MSLTFLNFSIVIVVTLLIITVAILAMYSVLGFKSACIFFFVHLFTHLYISISSCGIGNSTVSGTRLFSSTSQPNSLRLAKFYPDGVNWCISSLHRSILKDVLEWNGMLLVIRQWVLPFWEHIKPQLTERVTDTSWLKQQN